MLLKTEPRVKYEQDNDLGERPAHSLHGAQTGDLATSLDLLGGVKKWG
jgi:hypothetical protein